MKKKYVLYIIVSLLISTNSTAQFLSNKLSERPDGISISYFNSDDLQNWKSIFICDEFQILFPNRYYKKYYSVKIVNKDSLIQKLKLLVTREFIENLNNCCFEKVCPDTSNGYWIILKINGELYMQCIDKKFTSRELCGDETLDEVLSLFEELSK